MRGFTLAELMIVLILLGFLLGVPLTMMDRMDPGARGFQANIADFVRTSRERARATGAEVVLSVRSAEGDRPATLVRLSRRPVLEAGFEPAFASRERIIPAGSAVLGKAGRVGAGLDLFRGGDAEILGRGGSVNARAGFFLELDFQPMEDASATLLEWPGLVKIGLDGRGGLRATVSFAGGGAVNLLAPAPAAISGRWHRLVLQVVEGKARLRLDGRSLAEEPVEASPGKNSAPLRVGDPRGSYLGWVDELLAGVFALESGPVIPDGHALVLSTPRILLDGDGLLDPRVHPIPVALEILDLDIPVGGFLIARFGEEELP